MNFLENSFGNLLGEADGVGRCPVRFNRVYIYPGTDGAACLRFASGCDRNRTGWTLSIGATSGRLSRTAPSAAHYVLFQFGLHKYHVTLCTTLDAFTPSPKDGGASPYQALYYCQRHFRHYGSFTPLPLKISAVKSGLIHCFTARSCFQKVRLRSRSAQFYQLRPL